MTIAPDEPTIEPGTSPIIPTDPDDVPELPDPEPGPGPQPETQPEPA